MTRASKIAVIHFGNQCRVRCDNTEGGWWLGRATRDLSFVTCKRCLRLRAADLSRPFLSLPREQYIED